MEMKSKEKSIVAVGAGVYQHNTRRDSWVPVDSGVSRVDIYHSTITTASSLTNSFRIIGVDLKTGNYSLHIAILPALVYQKMTDTFHQCTHVQQHDGQTVVTSFGLNFRTYQEAEQFKEKMEECHQTLISQQSQEKSYSSNYGAINGRSTPSHIRQMKETYSDTDTHNTLDSSGSNHYAESGWEYETSITSPSNYESNNPPAHPPPPAPKSGSVYRMVSNSSLPQVTVKVTNGEDELGDSERQLTGVSPRRRVFAEAYGKKIDLGKNKESNETKKSQVRSSKTNPERSRTSPLSGFVTQEDFEFFKKEVFAYIDQAKLEIMCAINQKDLENG